MGFESKMVIAVASREGIPGGERKLKLEFLETINIYTGGRWLLPKEKYLKILRSNSRSSFDSSSIFFPDVTENYFRSLFGNQYRYSSVNFKSGF